MIKSIGIYRNTNKKPNRCNFGYFKATRKMRLIWLGPVFLIVKI